MNFVKAAWEEVLISCAALVDLDEYYDKHRTYVEKHPRRKIERDLYAFILKRKGFRRELLLEYLEEYSYWQNRPLLLTRIADFLAESGETQAASIIYKLATEKMNENAPLREVLERNAPG